jgi:hypothetical protein
MVPAAAAGIDVRALLAKTQTMVRACAASAPPAANPGLELGLILGASVKAGRDKLTILASPGLKPVGAWLEQLIAESTGKVGKGMIPVADERVAKPSAYGGDRLFAYLSLAGDADEDQARAVAALEAAGQPVVRLPLADAGQIGQAFFLWEIATAIAGTVIGINPFDQPDVEASKIKTRALTDAYETSGALAPEHPVFEQRGLTLFADPRNAAQLKGGGGLDGWLAAHFRRAGPRGGGRVRPALPPFYRTSLQGRPQYRRVSGNHRRSDQGFAGAGTQVQLRRGRGRPGARRPGGVGRTRTPAAARSPWRRHRWGLEDPVLGDRPGLRGDGGRLSGRKWARRTSAAAQNADCVMVRETQLGI